ncbi:hypothetical protein CCP2SC5_920004 [Azospirillaceae bacterium]
MGFDIIPDLFTNPWQVVLAKKIFRDTGDNRLKSISGAQGWDTDLIDKLVRLASDPLLPGANRWVYMNANANVTDTICRSFFNHVKDPDVIDSPSFIGDVAASIRDFLKGTSKLPGKAAEALPLILVILAGGIAAYFVFMGRGGKKVIL